MLGNNNRLRWILSFCLAISSISSEAQLIDMIADYAAEQITNKVRSYIYDAASSLWDEMVESEARDAIEERAKKLSDYHISQEELQQLMVRNGYPNDESINAANIINPISSGIRSNFNLKVMSFGNTHLSALGNGCIGASMRAYNDSVSLSLKVQSLEDVLSQTVMDSIAAIGLSKDNLLSDINQDPRLAIMFNNHPQIVRVYSNSLSTKLRTNPSHLYYWGVIADSHRKLLPRKTKLINPRFIKFEGTGSTVTLSKNGEQLGEYYLDGRKLKVSSIEILNLLPAANTSYFFDNTVFATDELGRVTEITFPLNKKGKKIAKSKVKYKDLCYSQSIEPGSDLYSLVMKTYKESPALAFALPLEKSENVKLQNKSLKKHTKDILEYNLYARAKVLICYGNASNKPSRIQVQTDYETSSFFFLQGKGTTTYDITTAKAKEQATLRQILNASRKSVVINGVNLRLRLGPSTSSGILQDSDGQNIHLPTGTQLQYMGESGDFYAVLYKGQTVYVSKQYSSILK